MLKLRRSLLVCVALLLAACGTQTQLPEAAPNEEVNLESASHGGHLKYRFHKYVYGKEHAPSHYYKSFIHCYKYNHKTGQLGEAVLKKSFRLSEGNLSLDSSAYGFRGYKCKVGEKAGYYYGKEYSVGDEVKIYVYEAHKHSYRKIYYDHEYADRETYTSGWFYPKKGSKLFIEFYNYYHDDDEDDDLDDDYGGKN